MQWQSMSNGLVRCAEQPVGSEAGHCVLPTSLSPHCACNQDEFGAAMYSSAAGWMSYIVRALPSLLV